MEGRLGSLGIALLGAVAAVACSTAGSTGKDGGASTIEEAGSHATGGFPDSSEGPFAYRFYTGTLDGTDARVGVIAGRAHARVYFCGGDSSYRDLSRWLPGSLDSSSNFSADAATAMGWTVQADVERDSVKGSLGTGDGNARRFQAAAVTPHTMAGLYEGMSSCGKVGLIVSQSSPTDAPVTQGACIGNDNLDIHQVNPVAPLTIKNDGTVDVTVEDTGETLALTPAVVAD